jgi:phospholipid/cholesterol/gamma-HCH transport system substrate-binding protein
METKANYVAVGAFVLICFAALMIALLWLGGSQYTREFAYYRTYFSGSVTGLGDGTLVRYNGIQVGRVSKVEFDPHNPKRVIVTLQVNPELPIHSDSVASIASEGLTGGSYVEIDGGSQAAPVLARTMFGEYPVIRSRQSTLQQLEQSAPQLLAKINRIAERLNDLLNDRNRKAFSETLANLRQVTSDFTKHSPQFDSILNNLNTASTGLNTDLSDLHSVLQSARETTKRIDSLAQNVDKLTGDINTQVNGARIDQVLAQTREMVKSITRLSDELDREPTRLLFGDRRKGYTPP